MKIATCTAAAALLCACAIGAERMTDRELDALVDQYVQCEHPDFVRVSIDELKADGRLTEPELAEAFYRGIGRFGDKKGGDWRRIRCLTWFSRMASGAQSCRLREFALSCDGELGRHAVYLYFDQKVGRSESLSFLNDVLRLNPSLHGAVWGALFPYIGENCKRNLEPAFLKQVMELVDKRAEDPQNAWPCDDILCQVVDGYAAGVKRKERLGRILASPGIDKLPQAREHFRRELKKLECLAR